MLAMSRLVLCLTLAAVAAAIGADARAQPSPAVDVDAIARSLVHHEAEVQQISQAVAGAASLGERRKDLSQRRMINAQVAFGVGDYDDAALMLYDLVEHGAGTRSYREALYYLAESLFQKKDYIGARNYFRKLLDEQGAQGLFYQQALERLVELSLKLRDTTDVKSYLEALDQIPRAQQRASVPYVRGRYHYFLGRYDQAMESFSAIPETSEYFVRAQYFSGAARVGEGNLAAASKIYQGLTRQEPKDDRDRRVIELSHMALGRIYYERDQATKAVDQYLMVSRKSDLFDEALYEVTWVYVKAQQFDKALRALELLALANPKSSVLPDVRILEGNLRIRKARMIEESGTGNALEEYNKAMDVFTQTRDTYQEGHAAIDRVVKDHEDPRRFVNQLTGRTSDTFDVDVQLPAVAVSWLQQQDEVSRVIDVDADLVAIRADINQAAATISRLERALDSPSRVNVFPELARRRGRLTEIFEDVQRSRSQLVGVQGELSANYASSAERDEYEDLRRRRIELSRELDSLPGANQSYADRVASMRAEYARIDKRAQEISVSIDTTQATLTAVEKYMVDEYGGDDRSGGSAGGSAGDRATAQRNEYKRLIEALKAELHELRGELDTVRSDIVVGGDQAGTSDALAVRAKTLRNEHRRALDAEHESLVRVAARMTGSDRTTANQIGNLMTKGAAVLAEIDSVNGSIDQTVDRELAEVRLAIGEEKRRLAGDNERLLGFERQAQLLGGDVLSGSFGKVLLRFYDVLIRSDVGVVDVAWASKESAETTLKRLTLEESRERRVLQDQFGRNAPARDSPLPPPPTTAAPPSSPAPSGEAGGAP